MGSAWSGGCLPGPRRGVCMVPGGWCLPGPGGLPGLGGLPGPGGCLPGPRRVCLIWGDGIPACTEADTPLCGQTHL